MNYIFGIDIGGTKTSVAIANANAEPIIKETFKTCPENGAQSLVERIKDTFYKLCADGNITKEQVTLCGVACPGPLDVKNGKIIHIATMGFRNVPIKQMLESSLSMPVFLENDANCAALAESVIGVVKGLDPLVYITVSTGVGCGIVVNGEILSGAFSSAGEIGHLTVEPNGIPCPCGKKGCLERYASGTAIEELATAIKGDNVTAKKAFELARNGDEQMKKIIDTATQKLALGLSSVYHLIDPQVIVLGGSVINDYDVFADSLNAYLNEYTQPIENRNFNIKISEFCGEQVLLGALIYAKQSAERKAL